MSVDKHFDKANILIILNKLNLPDIYEDYLVERNWNIISSEALPNLLEGKNPRKIDLVITDSTLSSFDNIKRIRNHFGPFELPILLIAYNLTPDDVVLCYNSGINDILNANVSKEELEIKFKNLLKVKKLNESNQLLHQVIDMRNQLTNITVHDLKNPVSIIIGLTKVCKSLSSNNEEQKEYLDLILESCSLMTKLINEFLDVAKLESGMLTLNKVEVDMMEVVNLVIYNNKKGAELKQQKIHFMNEVPYYPIVLADELRIKEIIDNLVSNAIKYSNFNSNIYITLQNQEIDEKGYIKLIVKDEGPGLSDEDKAKIFLPFQKGSATPTGGESSSGLGLTICKQLAELHDGFIGVDSVYGKGSEFYICLPNILEISRAVY